MALYKYFIIMFLNCLFGADMAAREERQSVYVGV